MRIWKKQTFGQQFDETVSQFPGNELMVDGNRRISFLAAQEEVNKLAKGLIKLGIKKGDNVAMWLPNYPEFLMMWLALSKIGAPLIPINTRYKSGELEYIVNNCDATTLFIVPEFLNINFLDMVYEICPELKECQPGNLISEKLPMLRNVICLDENRHPGTFSYKEILVLGKSVEERDLVEREKLIKPEDDLIIVYTSGTTGKPKGAVHTHFILKNEYRICNWRHITEKDRFLAFLPWFHVGGGFTQICPCLITGGCLVLMPYFDPLEAIKLIENEKITQLDGIPTHFIMILEHPDLGKHDFSSLKGGWVGGSAVTREVALGMINKLGMKEMIVVYGMTETTSVTTYTKIGDPIELVTSTDGIPISILDETPGFEVKVIDPTTGKDLPYEKEGEVCVRGDIVMKGYYKNPQATLESIVKEGWFHTGDLAVMFENGYIRITGRVKDMFIVGGTNTYPAEIEAFISGSPKVKMVQVVGVPDHRLGEVGAAFIELKEGERATEEEFIEFCKGKIANYKVPRYVKFLKEDEWPLTPSGKVQKFELRAMAVKEFNLKEER